MANFSPQRSGGPFGSFGGGSHGPAINLPRMTQILILVNIGVFIVCQILSEEWTYWILVNFRFDTLRFTDAVPFTWTVLVSPVTSQFLHAGWMHLLSNMISFVLFGTIVERAIGQQRMLALTLITGVMGNLAFLLLNYGHDVANIGASGAGSGLFGAAVRLLVRQRHGRDTRQIWIFAAIWVGIALLPAVMSGQSGIAWEVHVGGFLAGLLLIDSFDRRGRFRVM
jgi:membrane associated rhomboid family serine protease